MGFNSAFEGLNSVFYNAVQLVEKKTKNKNKAHALNGEAEATLEKIVK